MFPRAPTAVLRSRPLYAGETGRLEIELEAEQDTRIKYIDTTVSVDEGWVIGGGNNRVSNEIVLPVGRWRLAGPGVLPAGTNRYLVDVATPVIAPPSHEHAPAYSRLIVYVHVSIPWWPDGKLRVRYVFRDRIYRELPANLHDGSTPVDGPSLELRRHQALVSFVQKAEPLGTKLQATVGYTFLYWADPLRAANQLDRTINTTQPGGPARPGIPFEGDAFWAQGLNVGLQLRW